MSRKQQLLKRHRRNKRIGLLIALMLLIAIGVLVVWWLPLVFAVLGWIAHEAWFADHLFYSPKTITNTASRRIHHSPRSIWTVNGCGWMRVSCWSMTPRWYWRCG